MPRRGCKHSCVRGAMAGLEDWAAASLLSRAACSFPACSSCLHSYVLTCMIMCPDTLFEHTCDRDTMAGLEGWAAASLLSSAACSLPACCSWLHACVLTCFFFMFRDIHAAHL